MNSPCDTCKHAYHSVLTDFVECNLSGYIFMYGYDGNCESYEEVVTDD